MAHWTLDDIPWHNFDASKVKPEMVALAKAACMVEHNGGDYARYLCEVFADDAEFQAAAIQWAEEEVQHGRALRRWAELADPSFDFDKSFRTFTTGYQLPQNVQASVRGSRAGELIARCVVEVGTSSYYTAIKEAAGEKVLEEICARIAADEFRHYKLFYTHLQRYLEKERITRLKRVAVALSRIAESEDDELAYAFFAAQAGSDAMTYERKDFANRYLACICPFYRKEHIRRMSAMVLKAAGVRPYRALQAAVTQLAWSALRLRGMLAKAAMSAAT
jgi:rubrerythrin